MFAVTVDKVHDWKVTNTLFQFSNYTACFHITDTVPTFSKYELKAPVFSLIKHDFEPPPLWRQVTRKRNFISILFQLNDLVWKDKRDLGKWLFDRTKINVKIRLSGFICIMCWCYWRRNRGIVVFVIISVQNIEIKSYIDLTQLQHCTAVRSEELMGLNNCKSCVSNMLKLPGAQP
jgi:hypothetical protein